VKHSTPDVDADDPLDVSSTVTPALDTTGVRSTRRIEAGSSLSGLSKAAVGWVAAVAVVGAGAALAAVTFRGGDATLEQATGKTDTVSPACVWVTQADGPVVPQERFLAAPSADAILVFEFCDAEWTGHMAWLHFRDELSANGDDGLPNPWEAGNRAVEAGIRAVEQWLLGHTGDAPPGWRGL
jgi:hypothetical protein